MSEMQDTQRSAVVFGARNLGRAAIELLMNDGWAVTGAGRSHSTLEGVSAAGALALKADVTDPASVYGVLEQAASAHGPAQLVLNAATAHGGERTGPFGGGPTADADLEGFDSWAAGSLGASHNQRGRAGLRPHGIQVTLLIVDAGIQPLDGSTHALASRRKRWPTPVGSPMPSCSPPTSTRAPRRNEVQLTPESLNMPAYPEAEGLDGGVVI